MNEKILLIAVGRGRLPRILEIATKNGFVVFGMMKGQILDGLDACPVYLYETGWEIPRKLVAVGDLGKVWSIAQEDITEEEFLQAFNNNFGAECTEVLDTADKSFAYIAYNDTYFAVRDLYHVENIPLEKFLEKEEIVNPLNIIVS